MMTAIEIVRLETAQQEAAADLVAGLWAEESAAQPMLPVSIGNKDAILPKLRWLTGKAPAVAAVDAKDGRLMGFLSGMAINDMKGHRGIYTPEWAHAAQAGHPDTRSIYQAMYGEISGAWVANGCINHTVTLLAGQKEAMDTFFWFGHGMLVVDAVRSTEAIAWQGPGPAQGLAPGMVIRQATAADTAGMNELTMELQRHTAAAPTFLPLFDAEPEEALAGKLADDSLAWFIACSGDKFLGYMKVGPANPNAGYSIQDETSASISGAYLREGARGARGAGAAVALLGRCLAWARDRGYVRLGVDFESANVVGGRFWLRHFTPMTYSLIRKIDGRVTWANANRDVEGMF